VTLHKQAFFFAWPLHSLKIASVNIEIGGGGNAVAAFLGDRLLLRKHRNQIFTLNVIFYLCFVIGELAVDSFC